MELHRPGSEFLGVWDSETDLLTTYTVLSGDLMCLRVCVCVCVCGRGERGACVWGVCVWGGDSVRY